MMTQTIRVVLADDHPLVRAGIRTTLNAEQDFVLVGEATNGDEVRQLCQELEPDVLLLDLSMPGPPPADTVAYLRDHCPKVRVLALTAYDDDAYVRGLVTAGAVGYVLKDEATGAIVRAIHAVAQGDIWFSRSVVEKLAQWQSSDWMHADGFPLTERERQILCMMVEGRDNVNIAVELGLAEQTVRNYVSHIYAKLEVNSRTEAVMWARSHGLG